MFIKFLQKEHKTIDCQGTFVNIRPFTFNNKVRSIGTLFYCKECGRGWNFMCVSEYKTSHLSSWKEIKRKNAQYKQWKLDMVESIKNDPNLIDLFEEK